MKKEHYFLIFILFFFISACVFSSERQIDAESQYQIYCGSCHLAPDPGNIPKAKWEKIVLPEMAARLGYKYNNYNPLAKNSMEENLYIRMSKAYPDHAKIDSATWQQIYNYVMELAPETIPVDTLRKKRNSPSKLFKAQAISLDENEISAVTSVQFMSTENQFIIGNGYGNIYKWPSVSLLDVKFDSPVMSYLQRAENQYVTEVGYMNPSEKPLGTVYRIHEQFVDTLAKNLHRPVYTAIADLNDDGQDELLVCEFGNLGGQLSILTPSGSEFIKKLLLPIPGIIKLEILDLNHDGNKDIILLASQGNEGIFVLYGKGDLEFSVEQPIKLGPEYGSSWFELIDYNQDNHWDIILANGDNADYTVFLKPYHGIRLYLNDGNNNFHEEGFYPLYGATRILAKDYDQDGDLDFVALAYFPDYENSQEESIVFLQNTDSDNFTFEPHTFQESRKGRWLVMDDGDFDQDGDIDILLGSFMLPIDRKYMAIMDYWRKEKADLLLLVNKAKN